MWSLFRRQRRQTKPARRTPPTVRPRLEALEDRCLLSAGALDPTFGSGGTVMTALTKTGDYPHGLLLQPNGDLIAYGIADSPAGVAGFGLARYTPNGSPDKTFGKDGFVVTSTVGTTPVTTSDTELPSVGVSQAALQADGKVVAVGNHSYLIRYNSNGSLDTTFGSNGLVVVPSGFSAYSVLIEPSNGDVVVGGTDNSSFALLSYTPDGVLDSTFGSGGEVVTPAAAGNIASLALENGDLVASGGQSLARYTLSGHLDTTFGTGGIVINAMWTPGGNTYFGHGISSLLVQPSGEIVAVGSATGSNGKPAWALAEYNLTGSLDSTFGQGGIMTSSPTGWDAADEAALESNGQIAVVGWSYASNHFEVGVFNPNGSLDTSFGSGGFVSQSEFIGLSGYDFPGDFGSGVVIQSDGKIVTATSADVRTGKGSEALFLVARYGPPAAEIASFTASPNPVASGSSITLTASNITLADPSSTIVQVAFHLDSNNDGMLETTGTNADTVLGYATQTSPGVWTFTWSTAGLTAGTYTLFAQAEDSDGVFGDPDAITLTVQ